MTVELQVLCALRFYGTGSFQGMVASDEHVARDQKTVSVAVRAVSVAIVRRLGVQRGWIHFPETPSERFDAEKGFRLLGRIPGVIGCVDGTMVSIVGPSKNDPTVTKAAYWCRKYFYALNVMVVCDADCRIMCIDPRYPGSVHDSFVWQFSWLRNQLEQGQLPRDGRFLLGDSGYPLEPWLITPVPGNHATSTACGRFNKAHSSIRSVVERCIGLLKNRFRKAGPSSRPSGRPLGQGEGSEAAPCRPVRNPPQTCPCGAPHARGFPTTRDTVGKPLSALAAVVPSMDAASDREPLATTTEVLTTKDPVTSLPSVKPSPWKP
ncbi:putative nuclease HARBI1 isoform X1 [Ixodes scapularis]